MNDSQLFLVRVWSTRPRFRASVRAAGDEQSQTFTEPEQLTAFFARGLEEPHRSAAPQQAGETR